MIRLRIRLGVFMLLIAIMALYMVVLIERHRNIALLDEVQRHQSKLTLPKPEPPTYHRT